MGFSKRKAAIGTIRVRTAAGTRQRGLLFVGRLAITVALGRGGIIANKFEGDGGTPRGVFQPVRVWYRADRAPRPCSTVPVRPISPFDAWCEDPNDRNYNRPIRSNHGGDRLRRDDHLYDIIIEIDHNARPRIKNRGSAVFLHLARENYGPSAGCITMKRGDLRRLIAVIGPQTRIEIA